MAKPEPPAGYEADPDFDDSPEWTAADFARARPASEVHGPEFAALLVRKRGRPPIMPEARKEKVNIRLSPDVLAALRATGAGWQTRADELLRQGLKMGQLDGA
jgi:uncharacterized protein (DUF4415 family)